MHPELFKIPIINVTLWTYGLMMVAGFLAAVYVIRRLSRDFTPDPQLITNAALYSLIAGMVGARIFYVVHHFDQFRGRPLSFFAIWQGGIELLGGVILAIIVILSFLWYHKLPVRRYLDALAVGLMVALVFGRIGCFMRGCCFGRPTKAPWAVRFPYASDAYYSQIYPNMKRERVEPHLHVPPGFFDELGNLKSYELLTEEQKNMVDEGPYRCLPIHPTQLYASANAVLFSLILFLFWKRGRKAERLRKKKLFAKPGCTFALMFILYGIARFSLEMLRDDNPFEYAWWIIYKGGTVSQSLSIYLVILGVILMVAFETMKPDKLAVSALK
ncbi:MAG: prolipoprotein diacylglyceryl transferase [Planctomycetota bacterium]|jgi:phosphatidylglycerol:prolipoprotein diacylglycerol transferase